MKEKILTEAAKLFWKYGVRTITLDDIAKRLGISKKTIYQHFPDKEDIVYQVVVAQMAQDEAEFSCINDRSTNPVEQMLILADTFKQEAADMNPSVIMDVQRYYPKAWAVFMTHKENHILAMLKDNLQRGVAEGFYRPEIDIDVMARLRAELVQIGFDDRIFPTDRLPIYSIQDQLQHHFVRGLLTDKGFTIYQQHNQTNSHEPTTPLQS
jgi:TetR/AcrR family transcriptional regulator, cholesterol catabolism regulator